MYYTCLEISFLEVTLTNITKDEFLSIPIPLIAEDTQKLVKEKVIKANLLRDKGNQLLKYTEYAVEMAIEKDENIAITWLNAKIDELTRST